MTGATATLGEVAQPTRISDVRDLATIHVWHPSEPSAAGLLGIGKHLAYRMARSGELPVIRYGRRWLVPVERLLARLADEQTTED